MARPCSGSRREIPEGRLQGLRRDPRVAYVNLDQTDRIPISTPAAPPWCVPNDPHPACSGEEDPPSPPPAGQIVPWGVNRIGAYLNGSEGVGVNVYVIDTGIDSDHPDLQDNAIKGGFAAERCRGKGCVEDWDDNHGHGTHVAGTIAARNNGLGVLGVASLANLYAVKVCTKSGLCTRSSIIEGIDWVASHVAGTQEASVANISISGEGARTDTCVDGLISNPTDAYHDAICTTAGLGVVFVVAAGNQDVNAATRVPAAFDDAVVTVSATLCSNVTEAAGVESCDGNDDWPSFSNWGVPPVDLAAPGVSVLSTWNNGGTFTLDGTSMASPHVAGAAVLYLESPLQPNTFSAFVNTKEALLDSAEDSSGF